MITQQTAGEIWECYREIAAAEKLLEDIAKTEEEHRDDVDREKFEPRLCDVFGRRQEMELGVPWGHASQRLYGVSSKLAVACIKAHIAEKQAQLVTLRARARIELDLPTQAEKRNP